MMWALFLMGVAGVAVLFSVLGGVVGVFGVGVPRLDVVSSLTLPVG